MNKRQRQPTGGCNTQTAEKKKKPANPLDEVQTQSALDKDYNKLCDNMAGIDLLQELKNMEQRITATLKNDKESEIKNMEGRLTNNLKHTIDQSMKEAIQTLTAQSAQIISNNPTVKQNCNDPCNFWYVFQIYIYTSLKISFIFHYEFDILAMLKFHRDGSGTCVTESAYSFAFFNYHVLGHC